MRDGFAVVQAGISDSGTLGRLHSHAWRAAYAGIVPDAYLDAFTPARRAAFFRKILLDAENPSEQYLLLADGEAVGMLALGPAGDAPDRARGFGEIHALYLLPQGQGRGFGRAAMDFAVGRLWARGFAQVMLKVLLDNSRAIRFYTRYGFVPEGPPEEIELGRVLLERRYVLAAAARGGESRNGG